MFKKGDKIVNKQNPDWGFYRITKEPTPKEDWFETSRSDGSGGSVLDKFEANKFWKKYEPKKAKK